MKEFPENEHAVSCLAVKFILILAVKPPFRGVPLSVDPALRPSLRLDPLDFKSRSAVALARSVSPVIWVTHGCPQDPDTTI
jgi:hypothetical protein